jgi:hypothetical protein
VLGGSGVGNIIYGRGVLSCMGEQLLISSLVLLAYQAALSVVGLFIRAEVHTVDSQYFISDTHQIIAFLLYRSCSNLSSVYNV